MVDRRMVLQGKPLDVGWRTLEEQGLRVIRLDRRSIEQNAPELFAPIVIHNLKSSRLEEAVERFERALELRRQGKRADEIRQLLGPLRK